MNAEDCLKKKTWQEFQDSGMLWIVNTILHVFGWALVFRKSNETSEIEVFPVRCKYRGFTEETNDKGYEKVTKYLKENIDDLLEESMI